MERLIKKVSDFYLKSRDFNGIPVAQLHTFSGLREDEFKNILKKLIKDRVIDLVWNELNPHIKHFPANSVSEQYDKLNSLEIEESVRQSEAEAETFGEGEIKISWTVDRIGCCVYPSPEFLRKNFDWRNYRSRPLLCASPWASGNSDRISLRQES